MKLFFSLRGNNGGATVQVDALADCGRMVPEVATIHDPAGLNPAVQIPRPLGMFAVCQMISPWFESEALWRRLVAGELEWLSVERLVEAGTDEPEMKVEFKVRTTPPSVSIFSRN